jgi:hypothetical protein
VYAYELRNKKKEELLTKLTELKKELASARVQKAGNAQKGSNMYVYFANPFPEMILTIRRLIIL